MTNHKKKLVIIGGGPGGIQAAIQAKKVGLDVTLIEKNRMGGTYAHEGCVPSKALLKSAAIYEQIKRAGAYGITVDHTTTNLEEMVNRSLGIADRAASGIEFLLKKKNVKQIIGNAKILSPTQVEVHSQNDSIIIDTDTILIATGARPKNIQNVPYDKKYILSYREALKLTSLPKRLIIVGAGVLALEFAYYFRALGSEVVVIDSKNQILNREDVDIAEMVEKCFQRRGIIFEKNARVHQVDINRHGLLVGLNTASGSKQRETDLVLASVGVQPNMEQFDLDSLGIQYRTTGIIVNANCQTTVESIYAVGDVTGPPWTANAAAAQAKHAVNHIAGQPTIRLRINQIPTCAFFHPSLARVGYTEKQAILDGIGYKIGKSTFKSNDLALTNGDTDGLVKLLFDDHYGGLIGAAIVGTTANEMIHQLSLAMTMEATYDEIASAHYTEPSLSRAIQQAAINAQKL